MSFVTPAPGGTRARTDQGVDWITRTGGRIAAVASGTIAAIYPRLQGFGTTIIERLNSGQEVYYAEETGGGSPTVRTGQRVSQGQEVAPGTGSVIETGFWDPSTGRSAGAPFFTGSNPTPPGVRFRNMIGGGPNTVNVPNYVPGQYVSWVRTAAQQTGMPASVVASQIRTESGFDPNAVSGAGAQGIAQFLPSTFRSYGRGTPFNASDSLGAYVNYMNTLLRQYNGNIRDALAAYNAGSSNLSAGYGYADNILSAAGLPRSATSGARSSYGGTRPGGQPANGGSSGVQDIFTAYEAEVAMPRTAPSGFSGSNPFGWWWQSFTSRWESEVGTGT